MLWASEGIRAESPTAKRFSSTPFIGKRSVALSRTLWQQEMFGIAIRREQVSRLDINPISSHREAVTILETMNVSLTPELETFVRGLVETGRYNSSSEVVREALRLIEEREQLRRIKFDALRSEIQKGIDDLEAGRVIEWDAEAAKERLRRQLAAGA